MGDILTSNSAWIFFVVIFGGLIAYIALMQRIESARILKKFDRTSILLMSFGVNYFGLESEPGGPARSTGSLVLTKDVLYYRARHAAREVTIPGGTITNIEVIDTHKGKPLHQKVIGVRFLDADGKVDRAAFRIPHPVKWVETIRGRFMNRE